VGARASVWVRPLQAIGQAYFFKRQVDEATEKLLLSIQDHPGLSSPYRFLAVFYAQMGRLDEARAIVAKLRAIIPLVVPHILPFRNPQDCELLLSGLRLAADEVT
jgi:hypothetical protein